MAGAELGFLFEALKRKIATVLVLIFVAMSLLFAGMAIGQGCERAEWEKASEVSTP